VGLRPRTAEARGPRSRRGRRAGGVHGGLALRLDVPAGARRGRRLDLHGRPERDRRPAAPQRSRSRRGASRARVRRAGARAAGRGLRRVVARAPRPRGPAAAGARSDRARVLERHVAERGGRVPPPAARNGEDPNAKRPRAARVSAGRRAAVNREPTLDDLIGADMSGEERERLRQVHGMLLEAGPPPELSPKLEEGPTLGMTLQRKRALKRRGMLSVAAPLAVVGVFLAGYAVANRGGSGPTPVLSQALKGTALAPQAQGTLEV